MPPPINKLSNIPLERLSSMSGAVLAFTIESARWTVACSSSSSGLSFNEKRAFKNAGCLRGRNRSLFRDIRGDCTLGASYTVNGICRGGQCRGSFSRRHG